MSKQELKTVLDFVEGVFDGEWRWDLRREPIVTILQAMIDAPEPEPFGYWFNQERRFASLEEGERYFDDEERERLLIPLYTYPPAPKEPT